MFCSLPCSIRNSYGGAFFDSCRLSSDHSFFYIFLFVLPSHSFSKNALVFPSFFYAVNFATNLQCHKYQKFANFSTIFLRKIENATKLITPQTLNRCKFLKWYLYKSATNVPFWSYFCPTFTCAFPILSKFLMFEVLVFPGFSHCGAGLLIML